MKESRFLNRKWNIIISLVQGVPTFAIALYAILNDLVDTRGAMIAISIAGSLFCLILEYHSSVRYSVLLKETTSIKPKPNPLIRIILIIHNLAFWFFLIPLFSPMSYKVGFISFTAILFFRFLGNSYINFKNFTVEQYYRYPFRIP